MRRRANLWLLAFIVALTAFTVAVVWPDDPDRYLPDFVPWPSGQGLQVGDLDREAMRLGLDLKGGTYVLLEADTAQLPPDRDVDEALEGAKRVIENRVNAFGVAETEIQREGSNRLSVQLPGINPEQARELIGKTAVLEFREPVLDSQGNVLCQAEDGTRFSVPSFVGGAIIVDDQTGAALCADPSSGLSGVAVLEPATCKRTCREGITGIPLTGSLLRPNSEVQLDQQGNYAVSLEFNRLGGEIFSDVTGRLVGYQIAIFLDDEIIAAPTVQQQLSQESQITGLSLDEARTLRVQLNSGALPVPMRVIQQTEVDATLGDDTVRASVHAGLIGILAVMGFMVLYYRLPGLLAALALFVYSSLVLFILKVGLPILAPEGFTITLAGIAAFVLSVGMAVDANILVFERMKEELRSGRSLPIAIEAGFQRAWPSIRDSNASTIISALILWWFGEQFNAPLVIGFAKVLLVGVVISMFSAIIVTRTFLRLLVGAPFTGNRWLFGLGTHARGTEARPFLPDFVRRRGFYYLLSLLVLLPGIISLSVPPTLKPGIEFSSGTTFTIEFDDKSLETEDLRSALNDLGQPQARVQKTGDGEFILRMGELEGAANIPPVGPSPPSERDTIENGLRQRFGDMRVTNFNTVSGIVSRSIARDAAIAVIAASLAIVLYITYSFRNVPKAHRYGVAAIIATLHDAVFILGAFSIFGKVFDMEINTMFITGVLTIIGFSVHDTIVVFDRIRENVARNPGVAFDEVVNASLTETLGRSLNTSATLLFTIVALLLLGGAAIESFLLVLLIGVIAGTYSSIFVASQVLVSWEDGDLSRIWCRFLPRRLAPAEG
ncbi:MAG TPA: protein translocase subunit SecD [Dehalococcoidia bacterium]|nr:protein translocase subunit SecD [Dehalococcoidia bacterium]